MSYIIIDYHGGPEYSVIATNEDGIILVFEDKQDAEDHACLFQHGIAVELP